jgi:N,N-dimethylformamidase beta subunit-like, C-terminal
LIQGYPKRASVLPGELLTLHISADEQSFRLVVYRQGAALQIWHDFGVRATTNPGFQPRTAASQDFQWDDYGFAIPGDWPSGVYIGMLREISPIAAEIPPDKGEAVTDGSFGKVLFVVLPPPSDHAPILYKLPLLTYHAYNQEGGWSLYQASPVTLLRPGGGTGGMPWDAVLPDVYDTGSPRQTFAHWDARFIAWLESRGYQVHYCTDLDVHEDVYLNLLAPHALLVSTGHDEYWTEAMRNHVQTFVGRGGNVAFFSGNTAWWKVEFLDASTFRRPANWHDPAGPNNPEDSLIGVSYRNAGGWWTGPRTAVGYTVQHSDHWIFESTGLADGDVFGAAERLIGYECDGAEFDRSAPAPHTPLLNPWTPQQLSILAIGDLNAWVPGGDDLRGNQAATMVLHTQTGTVFNAATTDWPRVLTSGAVPQVERITANVIDRLGGTRRGLASLGTIPDIVAIDGFYSPDDHARHAIVATQNGDIWEIFFNPGAGQGKALLANIPGVVDVGAFYSDDDGFRHVIVATGAGDVSEIFYGAGGLGIAPLGHFPGVIAVAGFYSADDQARHAIVATDAGAISEIYFNPAWPAPGRGVRALDVFPGTVDVGAFFSPDDNARHVIVGTVTGDVHEIFFDPQGGSGKATLATIDDFRRVSAFYASGDGFFDRRVIMTTLTGRVHEMKFNPGTKTVLSVLTDLPGLIDVGGFRTQDDGFGHAILASSDGTVRELFYER